ncbi:alkaline phosphatase, partial [Streptomyces sp. NPDC059409]
DGCDQPSNCNTLMAATPHVTFFNGRRGYARVSLGRRSARADFKTVSHVSTEGAPLTTAGSFVTEVGEPGLKPA